MPSEHENVVTLIRHGETEWSRSGQHTGRTDIPLTEEGRDEARRVGRIIAGRRFALVLSSPLGRVRETAEIIGLADESQIDDDLREWDYGGYEGITTAEIQKTHPGWTGWKGPLPNGETVEQVGERVDRVIARARAADGPVALIGHGHNLRILAARWCELAPVEGRRLKLGTGTVCVLGWEHGVPAIDAWNAAGLAHPPGVAAA